MTDEQLDAEETYLQKAVQAAIREEAAAEVRAARAFETHIAKMTADYRIDRATPPGD